MRIPLLMDHHNHFFIYSMLADSLNLQFITEKCHAMELIEKKSDKAVSVVLGWNDSYFRFSERDLDSLPPVVICNLSLHGFLINSAARERLSDKDSEIVENIDNSVWREKHLTRILGFLAAVEPVSRKKLFDFAAFLEQKGIWASQDMFVSEPRFLEVLADSGLDSRIFPWTDLDTYEKLSPPFRNCIQGIKIFTDGALGARTAALESTYLDGSAGLLNFSGTELKEVMERALDMHHSLAIHAIGDRAISQVLENVTGEISRTGPVAVRMEHCQFISRENAFRAREQGLVLCMQPNFSSDSSIYQDRLPPGYARLNNPFRMLIDEAGFVPGDTLLFGSDGMPHGIREALRQALFPMFQTQRLTLDEFVAGYCWSDIGPGYIDVEIDEKKQQIRTRVILN